MREERRRRRPTSCEEGGDEMSLGGDDRVDKNKGLCNHPSGKTSRTGKKKKTQTTTWESSVGGSGKTEFSAGAYFCGDG